MDRLGNKRPRRGDGIPLNPVTLSHRVVGSIPTRCMPHYQRVTRTKPIRNQNELSHFLATFVIPVSRFEPLGPRGERFG